MNKWKYRITTGVGNSAYDLDVVITSPSGIEIERGFFMENGNWPDIVHELILDMSMAGFVREGKK